MDKSMEKEKKKRGSRSSSNAKKDQINSESKQVDSLVIWFGRTTFLQKSSEPESLFAP